MTHCKGAVRAASSSQGVVRAGSSFISTVRAAIRFLRVRQGLAVVRAGNSS